MRLSTDLPACNRVHVSNLLNAYNKFNDPVMSGEPDLAIHALAMEASAILNQFRKRGMDDVIERTIVKRTLEADNLEELNGLVATFKAQLLAHDADVAVAHAALAASGSATISAPDAAAEGAEARHLQVEVPEHFTLTLCPAPRIARPRKVAHRLPLAENKAALQATKRMPAPAARSESEPSAVLLTAFRDVAFDAGQKSLAEGKLERIRVRALCEQFRAINPAAPVSLKCYLSREALRNAVQANDISMLYVGRAGEAAHTRWIL